MIGGAPRSHGSLTFTSVVTIAVVAGGIAAVVLMAGDATTAAHVARTVPAAQRVRPAPRAARLTAGRPLLGSFPESAVPATASGASPTAVAAPLVWANQVANSALMLVSFGIAMACSYFASARRGPSTQSLPLQPAWVMCSTSDEPTPAKADEREGMPFFSRRDLAALLTPALLAQPAAAALAAEEAPVIPNPREWIITNLPGSLTGRDFARLTAQILSRQGITPQNSVPCVGVCRDELCQPLVDEIEGEWGDAFNMATLGGMLTLGKTGLRAAMAHSPVDEDGRERYFFLAFPHISVDTRGVGVCTRAGRTKPSTACGALGAFTKELAAGNRSPKPDALDPEYTFMKSALLELIPEGTKPDLLEVTKAAAMASQDQLEQLIAATVDPGKADYAVFVGILVHEQDIRPKNAKVVGTGREYLDQVYPTAFYAVKNGRKKDLLWRLDRD